MLKIVLFLVVLFLALWALRALRLLLASLFAGVRRARGTPARVEGEMVRDPVCGVWIDRRLALPAGTGPHAALVCSPECRRARERSPRRAAP